MLVTRDPDNFVAVNTSRSRFSHARAKHAVNRVRRRNSVCGDEEVEEKKEEEDDNEVVVAGSGRERCAKDLRDVGRDNAEDL